MPTSDVQFLAILVRRICRAGTVVSVTAEERRRLEELADVGHSSEPVRVDGQLAYEGASDE